MLRHKCIRLPIFRGTAATEILSLPLMAALWQLWQLLTSLSWIKLQYLLTRSRKRWRDSMQEALCMRGAFRCWLESCGHLKVESWLLNSVVLHEYSVDLASHSIVWDVSSFSHHIYHCKHYPECNWNLWDRVSGTLLPELNTKPPAEPRSQGHGISLELLSSHESQTWTLSIRYSELVWHPKVLVLLCWLACGDSHSTWKQHSSRLSKTNQIKPVLISAGRKATHWPAWHAWLF